MNYVVKMAAPNRNLGNATTFNPSTFEVNYGFEMLDTMHNFFPEMMYDDQLFPSQTVRWMRTRVQTLFPAVYTRQQSLYNIYSAPSRRITYMNWVESLPAPIQHSTRPSPALNTTPITVTLPSTVAPTAPASPAVTTRAVTPVRRVGTVPVRIQTANTNPLRTPVNLISLTGLTSATTPRHGLTGLLDPSVENIFETILSSALSNAMNGAQMNFEDVHVTPTAQEIENGSVLIEHAEIQNDTNCSICQEHGLVGPWRKLHCRHIFHKECIDHWFSQNVHCPVCRADIRDIESTDDEADSHS